MKSCEFLSRTEARSGIESKWVSESKDAQIEIAIPPEFAGPGGAASPEDLFSLAMTNCLVGTFKVYAHHSKLQFQRILLQSRLSVDKGDSGGLEMKSLLVDCEIQGASNPEKAVVLMRKAAASGYILNSVKTRLELNIRCTESVVS